jgi:hypothetical protein
MPKKRETIVFHYRGLIESRSGWIEGYSETTATGSVIYPWLGKRGCYAIATGQGKKAIFIRDRTPNPAPNAQNCP